MTRDPARVAAHYTLGDLADRLLAALESSGKDLDALTVDDLAPVDAFHIRGREATEQLADRADVQRDHLVLDVGCGVGGTSRYLAATRGCRVVGVDVTSEYCQVAEMLTGLVHLSDLVRFQQADALHLPFPDRHFDVVWTEHVQMNIADKGRFYGEIARVLKPGGQFAFHDIFAGAVGGLHLPVPWATEASISHLIDAATLRTLLADLQLEAVCWEDTTAPSIAFFESMLERTRQGEQLPLGLHLLMEDAARKLANVHRNLQEHRVQVAQALMRRASS
jgi:SAM-dependent methyltransferase